MRNEIPCRGVKLPSIKAVAAEWASANALSGAVHGIDDRDLARSLFMAEYQEDKLAGMFYVHEVLQKKGLVGLDWLDLFEQMYDQGYLYTWNTVDLFCIRVVRKMVEDFGDQAVAAISDWRFADNVWRARSSVVGLLCLSKKTEYRDIIWENCRVLICREERFAKTAVGWMMREIARWDEPHVKQFLEHFKKDMSLEATRNAAKHFSAAEKKKYVAMVKAAQRASDST